MRKTVLGLSLLLSSAYATDYGMLEYYFVDPDHTLHLAGRYRGIGKADFQHHGNGHVNYADAYGALFYTQFLNQENSLSWGLGYNYLKFDWEKNPRFNQTEFNYAVASLGYVSTSLENWRWIVNTGLTVDTYHLNFGQSAVYHGMLWGRYHFSNAFAFHVGALGWYGILNGYMLPIFGFEWHPDHHWTINSIFPVDFSVNYAFDDFWSLQVAYSTFGGPYRYPHRAYGTKNGYNDPIFMVYSNGVDLNLLYKYEHFLRIDLGVGWNFGGWIFIKNHENRHGKYFDFNSAPYAQGTVAFTF